MKVHRLKAARPKSEIPASLYRLGGFELSSSSSNSISRFIDIFSGATDSAGNDPGSKLSRLLT